MMGGPGSGQRPQKMCVADCRLLSIGELVAAARRQTSPGGEIVWRARRSRATLARLTYTITQERWPEGPELTVLALRY
jgi:hypothetical protein